MTTSLVTCDRQADSIPGYDPFAGADGFGFDAEAADRAVGFFSDCLTFTLAEWRGRPFVLQPWQSAIIRALFGWKRANGTRRYRECLIYIGRKNGKTELVAGLGCLLAFADGEPGSQVICAGSTRDQARLCFNAARRMVQNGETLSSWCKIYQHAIEAPESGSHLRVISAEAHSQHGGNLHGIIIDELHAQPNRELVDVLTTSTGSRRQPLVIHVTTADFDRPSICNEKYDYACKVRDGVVEDPEFLPVIYEVPLDCEWTDESHWPLANPNLGVSISLEYLRRECRKARETPTYENTFRRLHLNQRTQQDVRWLRLEDWDACPSDQIEPASLAGRTCYAGLDLSTTQDITAFVLVFPESDGAITVLPYFWVPEDGARLREKRDRAPYLTWGRQGLVTLTPGNVVDYECVKRDIDQLCKTYRVTEIAVDRWNATQIVTQLQQGGKKICLFGQGFKDLSAPAKDLERLIVSRALRHGGNPVLRWMASHVAAETDAAGNIKPSKNRSTERIDGIVAMIMALGLLAARGRGGSWYDAHQAIELV